MKTKEKKPAQVDEKQKNEKKNEAKKVEKQDDKKDKTVKTPCCGVCGG